MFIQVHSRIQLHTGNFLENWQSTHGITSACKISKNSLLHKYMLLFHIQNYKSMNVSIVYAYSASSSLGFSWESSSSFS